MTPAIDLLKKVRAGHKVLSYGHDLRAPPYGLETAKKLGLDPQRVFKTLFAATEKGGLLVAVAPVIDSFDLKVLAHAAGVKKADVADLQAAQRATGYLVNGVSPLGQKRRLCIFIDESARQYSSIRVSVGRCGLEVGPAVEVLTQLTQGSFVAIGREQAANPADLTVGIRLTFQSVRFSMSHYPLTIGQDTASSHTIVFNAQGLSTASCQQEFKQYSLKDGQVKYDGEEVRLTTLQVCRDALTRKGLCTVDIAAVGIANQRKTALVWGATSGSLIHPAIVWQDCCTADCCAEPKVAGHEANISARTGLLVDPYFLATKLRWILDDVPGTRQRAERGELRFGTVDYFLL